MTKRQCGVHARAAWMIFAIALLAPASAMAAGPDADEARDPVARGRIMAEEQCSTCHAVGKDDESAAQGAPAFRELGERYPVDQLEEALAEGIVTGHADMPEIEWEAEEVADFIAYLKSIND